MLFCKALDFTWPCKAGRFWAVEDQYRGPLSPEIRWILREIRVRVHGVNFNKFSLLVSKLKDEMVLITSDEMV